MTYRGDEEATRAKNEKLQADLAAAEEKIARLEGRAPATSTERYRGLFETVIELAEKHAIRPDPRVRVAAEEPAEEPVEEPLDTAAAPRRNAT